MSQYAEISDLLAYGLPSTALGTLTTTQQTKALEQASRKLDSFFAARYGQDAVPLLVWDTTVTEAVAKIAAYDLLVVRGYNPASSADVNIRIRHDDAMRWAEKVQKQQAHPTVTPAVQTLPTYQQAYVISSSVTNLSSGGTNRNRGW